MGWGGVAFARLPHHLLGAQQRVVEDEAGGMSREHGGGSLAPLSASIGRGGAEKKGHVQESQQNHRAQKHGRCRAAHGVGRRGIYYCASRKILPSRNQIDLIKY